MYALVRYEDNVYYVSKSKYVSNHKGVTKVTYKDGRKYVARVLAKNDDKSMLSTLKENILKCKPYILCNKLNIENNGNQDKTEAEQENCSNENTNLSISFDINTIPIFDENGQNINIIMPYGETENKTDFLLQNDFDKLITSIDENRNETEARNENCNQITDLSTSVDTVDIQTCNTSGNYLRTDSTNDTDISLLCSPNTFELIESENLDSCIKRLNFDSTEELLPGDTCILSTCRNEEPNHDSVSSPLDVENKESDSEYVPSEDDQNTSDNEINNDDITDNEINIEINNNKTPQLKKSILNTTISSISSLDASQINNGIAICDKENMHVESSDAKFIKQHFCMFCSKLQKQLPRHLEMIHHNEPDVKKFAMLPKGNPERKKIIDTLRKNGNFIFNTNSQLNNGQLIVCRRPNKKYKKIAQNFIACAKCKGFFGKNTIRHHSRSCFGKKFIKNKCVMVMGRKIECRLHSSASEVLRKTIFPVMREDEVTGTIRYDELLILYANKLCIKYKSQHHHDMIRARLRLLGRFLLAIKDINANIKNFEHIYDPKIYDDCIHAINEVAKYDPEEKMYKTPAVAANLSTLIKHIGNILVMECIKREDTTKKRQVKDFLKLLVVDIGTSINTTVLETQTAHRRRKKVNLPTLEDIQTLYKHLEKKRTNSFKELHQSFSYCHWISLAEATLTSIYVFNRRRAGEIERILIEDFNNYEKINENMYNDMYKSLSVKNKKIAQKYIRFCIRGKLGRTVPVLLSNDLFQSINLILKFRKQAGVAEKNPYIFGLPGNNKERYKYLRACVLIRKFSEECNANQSSTLRGTILRKHVATYCIQLNLNDVDISDLAMFMGHSDKIHKDHYRQPLASRDILKISQYLEAVQGNTNNSDKESAADSNSENGETLKENSFDNNNKGEEKEAEKEDNLEIISDIDIQDKQNKRKRSISPYGKTKRIRWSKEEKEIALQVFSEYMEKLKLPSLHEIQTMKKKYTLLARRSSPQIKTWLHNQQKALRRQRLL